MTTLKDSMMPKKMNRVTPILDNSCGHYFASMMSDIGGEYISVNDVVEWIRLQHNNTPVTGAELANGFLFALDGKTDLS